MKNIKSIAFNYFKGAANAEEEKELLAFISQSSKNRSIFKTWENEWYQNMDDSVLQSVQWDRVSDKISSKESEKNILPLKSSRWKYFSIAASIAILFSIGIFAVYKNTQKISPEHNYLVEVPLGQKSKITLSDGSVVWLNAGSSLTYSDAFGKKNRHVSLIGEAYFDVAKSKQKFVVTTPEYAIEVKGTKFNVAAYPDDDYSCTSLLEGSVHLIYRDAMLDMKPGETLQLDKMTRKIVKKRSNVAHSMSWSENRIEFDNIRLADLIKKLSREYNRDILLSNEDLACKSFSISIRNQQTLHEVLKAIANIVPMRIIQTNDTTIQLM